MKKLYGLLVAFLLVPALYAEQRADQTWEKAIQKAADELKYQTADDDWTVLKNSPEEGFSAATGSGTGQVLVVLCAPNVLYGAVLFWHEGADALGTYYDDHGDQPVTLNWRNPDLTQQKQWIHLSYPGKDFDSVGLDDLGKPQETDRFLDRLTRHTELNTVVTVSAGGRTKQATFSLDGAPSAETVKACGQEQASSETTLYFPDYVDGGRWSVQLALSNVDTAAPAEVVVAAYDQEGQPVPELFDFEATFEIPSLGNRVLRSAGVGQVRRGWIELRTDSASVSGLLTYRHAETGIEVGVEPVELGDHFALFVEESSDIGTGLAIFKPDSSPRIELRIRDEEGSDPLEGVFIPWGNFNHKALTIPEWLDVDGVDTEFIKDFRGLLFLRSEDGSLFAPLGLRFEKRGRSLSAVPVIKKRGRHGRDAARRAPDGKYIGFALFH